MVQEVGGPNPLATLERREVIKVHGDDGQPTGLTGLTQPKQAASKPRWLVGAVVTVSHEVSQEEKKRLTL